MQLHDRERIGYRTVWTCEKWSEEAVDYSRKVLDAAGISHIPAELVPQEVAIKRGRINKLFSEILGRPMVELVVRPRLMPITEGISSQMLRALVGAPEEAVEIEGNLLLNEGIQRFMDMTMIATLTGTGWNNANAFLGVGDSSTAEAATQTELQAATNRFYKAMNATSRRVLRRLLRSSRISLLRKRTTFGPSGQFHPVRLRHPARASLPVLRTSTARLRLSVRSQRVHGR
jgi:hypothetical protein